MTHWVQAILLGILQGITEFLPISSSGHLVIAEHFLKVKSPGTFLEVMLHAGTLLSILAYFFRNINELVLGAIRRRKDAWQEIWRLFLSALPAVAVFVLFGAKIESAFEGPKFSAVMLIVTGVVVVSLRFGNRGRRTLNAPRALVVGLAQACALFPGVSRSGVTITAARHLGVEPRRAAEFSMLMSVPLLAGATVMKLLAAYNEYQAGAGEIASGFPLKPIFAGAAVSALVGYAAIALLVRTLVSGYFWLFGFYCISIGIVLCLAL